MVGHKYRFKYKIALPPGKIAGFIAAVNKRGLLKKNDVENATSITDYLKKNTEILLKCDMIIGNKKKA